MCYISYQTDRYLAAQDRDDARNEWLGMQAQNDSYKRYLEDAAELGAITGEWHLLDNGLLQHFGLQHFDLMSDAGIAQLTDRAMELAAKDGFNRYDEE